MEYILNQHQCNVVSICEHWLDSGEIEVYSLENYNRVSHFCRSSMRGGGTAIYSNSSIQSTVVDTKICSEEQTFEHCAACFYLQNEKSLLVSIYRSPRANIDTFIEKMEFLLKQFTKRYKNVLVIGDFNVDVRFKDNESVKLLDLFQLYNFKFIVFEPTRYSNGKGSVLDNCFINFDIDQEVKVINTNISDHFGIEITIKIKTKVMNHKRRARLFNEPNRNCFYNLVEKESWTEVYNSSNTMTSFTIFYDLFLYYFNLAFPEVLTNSQAKNKTKHVQSKQIIDLSKELKNLYWLKVHYNNEYISNAYMNKKIQYRKLIQVEKSKNLDRRIAKSQNPSKCVWDIMKELTGKGSKTDSINLRHDGKEITDPMQLCNLFNNFFISSSQVQRCADGSVQPTLPITTKSDKCIFLHPVDEYEIMDIIRHISIKKSSGLDQIPCHILKNVAHLIAKPLSFIINNSLLEGTFPSQLKRSKVIPIYKKGDKTEIENYRPVSVPSAFSKIFERIMYSRLLRFLIKTNFFNTNQHGFMKNRSTCTALYDQITKILTSLDEGEAVIGAYFDLTKAFDLMNHGILFSKLQRIGINGICLKWIRSFLENRTQTVQITGENDNICNSVFQSNAAEINIGTPQGSILAPLLFLIYVNDLPNYLSTTNSSVIQFADDTSVLISHKDLDNAVIIANSVATKMVEWCHFNHLVLNPSKTNLLNFRNIRTPQSEIISIVVKDHNVNQNSSTKFLGIQLNQNLDWSSQGDNICNKIASANYAIMNLRGVVNTSSLLSFYYAYVESRLSYGIIFWGSHIGTVHRVFLMQKKIIRNICGAKYLENCAPLFYRLKIMSVFSLYIYNIGIFVRDNLHKFISNGALNTGTITTRQKNNIAVPRHSTALFETGPHYMGVKIYNYIPEDIKKENVRFKFKNKMKIFFRNHPFYSLEEFYNHKSENCTYCNCD